MANSLSPTERRNQAIAERARSAAAAEPDTARLLEQVVELLKTSLPAYTWVGVYLVKGDELVLGPFLGKPSPHTRIPIGRGICGSAAAERQTIIVDDVNADERYLACSLETRSEIVVPIILDGNVVGELDIDSDRPAAFTAADRQLLETLAAMLAGRVAAFAGPGIPGPTEPTPRPEG
jgi:L-methionine (R)-S-oxide reductase